jgi:serine phosphatase RsbU (regulator of sigma subunit)
MARNIQESILPTQLPSLPGWKLAAHWQPARMVSGDFYDFVHFPDGCLGLMIGDVTGKGVPAALVISTTRSVLRSTAIQQIWPGQVLQQANQLLCEDMLLGMYVTCLYAVLNPIDGSLRIANAGHTLPCQKKGGNILELRARGMPLGLLPDMDYEETESHIGEGECVVFLSDGITEAHNPQREMYGTPRLLECLAQSSCTNDMINSVLKDLTEFTGFDCEQEDDVTIVTLERS